MSRTDYDYICPGCEEPNVTIRKDGTARCHFCGREFGEAEALLLVEADNDPGDIDGETLRGSEAAGFAAEQSAGWQRLK